MERTRVSNIGFVVGDGKESHGKIYIGFMGGLAKMLSLINHHFWPFLVNFALSQKVTI